MTEGGFEVVLSDCAENRTGIQADMLAGDNSLAHELVGQLDPNLLKDPVRAVVEESTETFQTGGRPIWVESEGGGNWGIFLQRSVEVPEETHASEPLVDQRLQQAEPIDRWTSGRCGWLWAGGQELEELFPSQAWG